MKTILKIVVIIVALLAILFISQTTLPRLAAGEIELIEVKGGEPKDINLLTRQFLWLHNLRMCESGGDDNAINPEDLDGTASYSRYQFKPSTLESYTERYELRYTNVMDAELQDKVIWRMLDDLSVKWSREFPACTRKYGLPPTSF